MASQTDLIVRLRLDAEAFAKDLIACADALREAAEKIRAVPAPQLPDGDA